MALSEAYLGSTGLAQCPKQETEPVEAANCMIGLFAAILGRGVESHGKEMYRAALPACILLM